MSSRSLPQFDGNELTNEAISSSTNCSTIDEQSGSPNPKNTKWSLMASVRSSQHSGSINTPPSSFRRERLFSRGEYKSPPSAATKKRPTNLSKLFSSPSTSWIVKDRRKSVISKADVETSGLTIDAALGSLYDESDGIVDAKSSCLLMHSGSPWWTLDGNYCYNKGDSDTIIISHQNENFVRDHRIDESALTSQLFAELNTDPLISFLIGFTDVNEASSSLTNSAAFTDSNVLVEEEEDGNDFGDFQSAACVDASVSMCVEEYETRKECLEIHTGSLPADSPCDYDPNVETLPEKERLEPVVRTLSFDHCEKDAVLLQYIDSLCASPVESASIAASLSIDTPDLVRMVDEVIQASIEMKVETVATESERTLHLRHPESLITENASRRLNIVESVVASPSHDEFTLIEDGTSEINNRAIVGTVPLSMILPVGNNLSTLEARFTRRLQQQYLANETGSYELVSPLHDDTSSLLKNDQSDLPPYYFACCDVDDTICVLQSLPWQYVALTIGNDTTLNGSTSHSILHTDDSLALWDEYITSRLCQFDTSLEHIQSETFLQIQPFQPSLIRANALMHEWDQSLRLAFMYWERSKRSLSAVVGAESDTEGLTGATFLLQAWREREEYLSVVSVLDELDDVRRKESELLQRVDNFDVRDFDAFDKYLRVLQLAKSLEDRLLNGRLANLRCLKPLRERLQNVGIRFWNRLLEVTRSCVVQSCKPSSTLDWDEYDRLFHAFLDLKAYAFDVSPDTIEMQPSSWADNILKAFAYEADAAFALSLLYPTDYNSHHENGLKEYAHDLDSSWGDYSRLRSITHNLVNTRFEHEWNMNYLPHVIHQLCKRLADILHSHVSFVKWHKDLFQAQLQLGTESTTNKMERHTSRFVHDALLCYSPKLWEHCESIVAKCLDEYLNFSPKRSLFHRRNEVVDDSLWHDDLHCQQMVHVCVSSFLSYRPLFLKSVEGSSAAKEVPTEFHSVISDKLTKVFCRHLRLLHVEAMNTVGRCLANESWILGSMAALQTEPEQTEHSETSQSIQKLLTTALRSASSQHKHYSRLSRYHFSGFEDYVNPFDSLIDLIETEPVHVLFDELEYEDFVFFEKLLSSIDQDGSLRIAPVAVTEELIVWLARLLLVMERLPLIAENASEVIINLCDLYFTTAFRLCTGNSKSDRLVLGEDSPSLVPFPFDDQSYSTGSTEKTNGTLLFGSFRSSQQKTSYTRRKNGSELSFPVCLDAEICSPNPRDFANIRTLHSFICRAQTSLRHVVNLDMVDSWLNDPNTDSSEERGCEVAQVLTKRQGAIWSCFTVAALVKLLVYDAKINMTSSFALEHSREINLIALQEYCETVFDVVPTLVRVASQMACVRAIEGSTVVREISKVGVGWEESKLHEDPNNYVDDLCNRCSLIWGYSCASTKLPNVILEETWEGLVSASYLALLEGYSRVRRCSTEGRAHMTLDLASFRAGISPCSVTERFESLIQARKPPSIDPEVGSMYVETYIKAFYYPKDDVIAWINQNWNRYKMNHVMALAATAILSSSDPCSEGHFCSIMDDIRALYHVNNDK